MSERAPYDERRPYLAPVSLAALHGPASGELQLPPQLAWTGRKTYRLDDRADLRVAYERILLEATSDEQLTRLLNPVRLREVWPELFLPAPVRSLWQERFPDLSSAA